METVIKNFISLLKDFQGIIGVLFGFWIATQISKKERKQKDTITESERIDRYRLSAINERLKVHQQAFEIWYYLSLSLHADENIQIKKSNEARDFWVKNCLYLTPKSRDVFNELINLYEFYKVQWIIWREARQEEKMEKSGELISSFNKIMSVGRIIQEEVDNSYTEPEKITALKKDERNKLEKSN
jgi:hypothetical protein